MRIDVLPQMHLGTRIRNEVRPPHPGGNTDVQQTKEVAGKAICKTMKTKGRQTVNRRLGWELKWRFDVLERIWGGIHKDL